jgi:hypothetical protein
MAGYRIHWLWASRLCLLILLVAHTQTGSASQTDTQLQLEADKETSVPFEYFNQHIFLTLTVDGHPSLYFLFDTGTSTNILDLEASQRLGLKLESMRKEKDLGMGNGKVSMAAATDVDARLGDVRVANKLAIVDLHGLQQVNGHKMDGILGFPLLERFVVELDFQSQMLTLYPARSYKYKGSGDVLILSQKKYPATVPVVLGTDNLRQQDTTLEVDTGSDATVILYSRLHLVQDTQQPKDQLAYGIGGSFPVQLTRLRFIEMGNSKISPLTAIFMETTPSDPYRRKMGGAMGTAILAKYQRLIFDVPHKRIILESPMQATALKNAPHAP